MYKEPTERMMAASPDIRIRQIQAGMTAAFTATKKYSERFLVFLVSGLLLFFVMQGVFNAGADDWLADPAALRVKDLWRVLMYAVPYTLLSLSAGCLATGLLLDAVTCISGYSRILYVKWRSQQAAPGGEGLK